MQGKKSNYHILCIIIYVQVKGQLILTSGHNQCGGTTVACSRGVSCGTLVACSVTEYNIGNG